MSASTSDITNLQGTLTTALEAFKASLRAQGIPEPALWTAQPHPLDDPTFLPSPALYEAQRAAVAALGLLTRLVQPPHVAVASVYSSPMDVAAVEIAAKRGISDILAEAPDPEREGMSAEELAERLGANAGKLERVMRLLVSMGYYRETRVGWFANARLGNLLKRGTPGWNIHNYAFTELSLRSSTELATQIFHPDKAFRDSTLPEHCAFSLAYGADNGLLAKIVGPMLVQRDTYIRREVSGLLSVEVLLLTGVSASMNGLALAFTPGIVAGFPWEEMAKGMDAVVDIGGGRGTLCCALAETFPTLPPLVVQDLESARGMAEAYIASKGLSNRISFEAQNFFEPQKRGGRNLYIIQRVLHDWSREKGVEILGHLREGLQRGGVLCVIEDLVKPSILPPAGVPLEQSLPSLSSDPAGPYSPLPPPPLVPADFGAASHQRQQLNVILTALFNASELTEAELTEIVELAGLKVQELRETRAYAVVAKIVAA